MRIAVLILGLILGAFMLVQTTLVAGLSGMAEDSASQTAGGGGIIMAVLWLIACALVIPIPLVSTIIFALAGLIGFAFAGDFSDLAVWAVVSLVLAAFSFFGWIGKRKADRRERHRDALMAQTAAGSHRPPGDPVL